MKREPQVILALDVDSFPAAKEWVDTLYPKIGIFKVGAQLFTACGPEAIRYITGKGAGVFLDLKFFDIPNTVASAARQAVRMGVKMFTLHILGDERMIRSAVSAAEEESAKMKLARPLAIGVTVLTSKEATSSDVLTLARLGLGCGLDGIVCSARELPALRKELGSDFIAVTPGIRPDSAVSHDQKRTATVKEAVAAGSDYLVVGRPILEAKEPVAAAEALLRGI